MKRWSVAFACLTAGTLAGTYFTAPFLKGQDAAPAIPAIPKELVSYRDIVKRVLPAVVNIEAKAKVIKTRQSAPKRDPRFNDKQLPDEFRRFFEDKGSPFDNMPDNPSPKLGFGSGFIVDAKGVILTNNHVVEGADQVTIELQDGRKFVSRDIKTDRKTDLAIVRIDIRDGKPLPFLELADSEQMEMGDRVLAFGAPFGLTGSVTHGIISAKGRAGFNMNMYEDFLQTDAAINPGNSGGPLVNLEGKVVGINAAIKSRSGGFQGVGLAVASNLARNVMHSLMKDGVVRRGYLGVQIRDLSKDVADHLGLKDQHGVVVGQVYDNSPASKAGLKAGDIITKINGQAVKDGRVLQTLVAGLPLQKAVEVTVVRDGKTQVLQVSIEEQPQEFGVARGGEARTPERGRAEAVGVDKVGVSVADLTPEMAEDLGYKSGAKGVVIMRVDDGTVAFEAGLRKGMLISKVDNQTVTTANAAREALEKGSLRRGILLQVQSPQGGANYVLLQQTETANK